MEIKIFLIDGFMLTFSLTDNELFSNKKDLLKELNNEDFRFIIINGALEKQGKSKQYSVKEHIINKEHIIATF